MFSFPILLSMNLYEFEKFIEDTKIYDKIQTKKFYYQYSTIDKLSFFGFKFAINKISKIRKTDYENIINKITNGLCNLSKKSFRPIQRKEKRNYKKARKFEKKWE